MLLIKRSSSILLLSSIRKLSSHRKSFGAFLSNKNRVKDFVSLLNLEEKRLLYEQLQLEQELIESSPKTITIVDSSSTTKTINLDELRKLPPNFQQLMQLFFSHSLPFIGFGFLDNLLMIVAGDYIDLSIGVTLGISTMAAAGLGNALSDIAGVGSAYYVEQLACKIGFKPPKLSLIQLQMPRTRWTIQLGRAFGVAIGCIIGMFPLLFLPHRTTDKNDDKNVKPKNE